MKTEYGNIQKAACTHPTGQTEQSLNLNSAHEMPAVAHAPRFGAHSTVVYNDEIKTSHFADAQAACAHVAPAIARNFIRRNKRLYDGDSDGKSETYPVELSIKCPSPNIAIVEYTRETLFQRKGHSVKITIKRYAP